MANSPRAVGVYCRLSYAPDGSLEKVERQEVDCRQVGDRLAWPISEQHIYTDNSRSAWQRKRKRPAWDRMLLAIEAGEIDALIVYHGDRLIRQPYDLEKLIGVADSKGVRIASVTGTRNLDSPDDRFVLRIEAAQACRESDNTSRRVRRGWASRAAKGHPSGGGKRPFGFADLETVLPEEANVLAEAVDRLLAGQSQGGVVRWMNTVSTTSQGNRWTGKTLKNLLMAPRIAGLVEHDGNLYDAVWNGIVGVEAWGDVKILLARSAEENPYPGRERKYMLSGVAECRTGHRLATKPVGGRNKKTARIYWCKELGCPTQIGRSVEYLDAYVSGRAVHLLNDPKFITEATAPEPSVAPEIASLERRRDKTKRQIDELVDHPELDGGLLVRAVAGFEQRIAQLRNQHARTARERLLARVAGISAEEWEDLPIDIQADVVKALFRVVVLPTTKRGPGFDVTAVEIHRVQG
jgi:DNA invertase Pin-like site-specific DNA recombinase